MGRISVVSSHDDKLNLNAVRIAFVLWLCTGGLQFCEIFSSENGAVWLFWRDEKRIFGAGLCFWDT